MKLDLKDKKILVELDRNARIPASIIAKKVRLSKQSVINRINKMEKEGIIAGYYTITDIFKVGRIAGRLWINLQRIKPTKEAEIIKFIAHLPNTGWIAQLDGAYDLVVIFWVKDLFELKKLRDKLIFNFSNYIKNMDLSFITREHHLSQRYFYEKAELIEFTTTNKYEEIKIDDLDRQILIELAKNGRISLVDLTEKIKASEKTIKYRIKKMEKNKIILGYRIKINHKALGYTYYKVFLKLKELTEEKINKMIDYLKKQKEIIFVTEILDKADLEFEMVVPSHDKFQEFIRRLKNEFSDIFDTFYYVTIYKINQINYFPIS